MIIHSPQPWRQFRGADRYFEGNRETWRPLEEANKAGKLRAIGLSNFEKADIDNILAVCSVKPMVNQILAHISNTPIDLIQYTQYQTDPLWPFNKVLDNSSLLMLHCCLLHLA